MSKENNGSPKLPEGNPLPADSVELLRGHLGQLHDIAQKNPIGNDRYMEIASTIFLARAVLLGVEVLERRFGSRIHVP